MEKNVTQPKGDSIQDENRSNNFRKRVVTPTVIKWKWQTYSACHWFLVVSKSYLDSISFSCTQGTAVIDALSTVATSLLAEVSLEEAK